MRILITALLLLTSFSDVSACTNFGTRLPNFLNRMFMLSSYRGFISNITMSIGSAPVVTRTPGGYGFEGGGLPFRYRFYNLECGEDLGQCRILSEDIWRYNPINRCLSIDLTQVTVTRVTENELRFFYVRGGRTISHIYQLPRARELIVIRESRGSDSSAYSWFRASRP